MAMNSEWEVDWWLAPLILSVLLVLAVCATFDLVGCAANCNEGQLGLITVVGSTIGAMAFIFSLGLVAERIRAANRQADASFEQVEMARDDALLKRFTNAVEMLASGEPVRMIAAEEEFSALLKVGVFNQAILRIALAAIPRDFYPSGLGISTSEPSSPDAYPDNHVAVLWRRCRFSAFPPRRIFAYCLREDVGYNKFITKCMGDIYGIWPESRLVKEADDLEKQWSASYSRTENDEVASF